MTTTSHSDTRAPGSPVRPEEIMVGDIYRHRYGGEVQIAKLIDARYCETDGPALVAILNLRHPDPE